MGKIRSIIKPGIVSLLLLAISINVIISTDINSTHASSGSTNKKDSLSLSVGVQCAFRTIGDPSTGASAEDALHIASGHNGGEASFTAGGTRNFNILCNQPTGYAVKAYATDLTRTNPAVPSNPSQEDNSTIPFVSFNNYNATKTSTPAASIWSAEIVDGDSDAIFGNSESNPLIIKSSNTTSNLTGDTFTVNYKAYIGTSTPAGTYEGKAVYQLLPNAPLAETLADATTMQTATREQCINTPEGTTVNLIDSRGPNYSYLIRKMKDGNCWMIQNLALPGDTTITDQDSDLNTIASYTLPSSKQSGWNSNTNEIGWVYNGTHQDSQYDTGVTIANTPSENTGGYYSFVVATAGLDPTISSGVAPDSICPKGWKLPTGGADGQMQTLYNAWLNDDSGEFDSYIKRAIVWGVYDNAAMSYRFTSYCDTTCPSNNNASYWWLSTILSDQRAYLADMSSGNFNPKDTYYKRFGYSVRCVLTGV